MQLVLARATHNSSSSHSGRHIAQGARALPNTCHHFTCQLIYYSTKHNDTFHLHPLFLSVFSFWITSSAFFPPSHRQNLFYFRSPVSGVMNNSQLMGHHILWFCVFSKEKIHNYDPIFEINSSFPNRYQADILFYNFAQDQKNIWNICQSWGGETVARFPHFFCWSSLYVRTILARPPRTRHIQIFNPSRAALFLL